MKLQSRLSVRVVIILLAGFVALQILVVIATALPSRGSVERPYGLPLPREVGVMIDAIERAPPADRPQLVRVFDQGLYSVGLSPEGVMPSVHATTPDLVLLGQYYATMLPGHAVAVDAKRPTLGAIIGTGERPARFFAPVSIAISLNDGSALVLTSKPSGAIRDFLRRRSILGAAAGLILLIILVLAMRQTMRPVVTLAAGVRRFGAGLDAPDLPVEGTREVRDLAVAFNDMKRRISALMAERTRTLAAIAHDMRTYLTRMRLRAEFIDDADHRDRAVRDLDEMAALLDDTLLLARTETVESEPPPRVDLRALVAEAAETYGAAPEALQVTVPEDAVPVQARPLAVRRILANLLDNGLRHGTKVELSLASRGGQAVLTVTDNGPGMSAESLARLGEPFHRSDPSRNRDTGGAGLGLAIVSALAARDGAQILFENRACGGFRATLRYRIVPIGLDPF